MMDHPEPFHGQWSLPDSRLKHGHDYCTRQPGHYQRLQRGTLSRELSSENDVGAEAETGSHGVYGIPLERLKAGTDDNHGAEKS